MGYIQVEAFIFGATAVEQFAGPMGVGVVIEAGRRREVSGSPALLAGHGPGDFAQLLELGDPEVFIHIQIAVIGLGRAVVGPQQIQDLDGESAEIGNPALAVLGHGDE